MSDHGGVCCQERIEYYKLKYVSLDPVVDRDCSFLKIVNVGKYHILNNVRDYLQMRISR